MYRAFITDLWSHDALLLTKIIAISFISSLLESSSLVLLAPLMVILTNTSSEVLQWPLNNILSVFSGLTRETAILFFASTVAVLMMLRFMAIAINYWLIGTVEGRYLRRLRSDCLNVLLYGPQSFIDSYDNARAIQHFNEQSLKVSEALRIFLRVIAPIITVFLNLIVIFWLSPLLAIASIILLTLVGAALTWIPNIIEKNAQRYVQAMYNYNIKIVDLINGIKTVRSFATFQKEQLQTTVLVDKQIDAHKKKIFYSGITTPIFEVVGFMTICVVLILSIFLLDSQKWLAISGPFFIVLARSISQAAMINNLRSQNKLASPDYNAVRKFADIVTTSNRESEFSCKRMETIECRKLHFAYEQPSFVLQDINLLIKQGDWVLIYGPSGMGKSTLLSLIIGLYEPTSGDILINGKSLSKLDKKQWSEHVGVIEQIPFIFNDTIRNNIAYKDKHVSENDIWEALECAHLATFVRSLPAGLETQLGDRGENLSGGQRQRLAFARALCHKPDLLILDEPTSALDQETEQQVLMSLKHRYSHQETIIAVSHSEVFHGSFEKVFYLDNGRLHLVQN